MNGRECLRPQRLMDQLSVRRQHAGLLKAHINTQTHTLCLGSHAVPLKWMSDCDLCCLNNSLMTACVVHRLMIPLRPCTHVQSHSLTHIYLNETQNIYLNEYIP